MKAAFPKLKLFLLLIIIIVLIYVIGSLTITAITFKSSYKSYSIPKYSSIAHWDFYEDRYSRREVYFNSRGNILKGHIYEAENPKGLIVFSHGIWSGPEEYLTLITWFVDHGWDVFAYTYTAYNGSDGHSAKGLPQSPIDLDSALTYVESNPSINQLPRIVMGHSWGAYATTAALSYGHHVDGVVALSGFSDPVEISVSVAENMIGPIGKTIGWSIDLFDKILFGKESRQTAVDGINSVDVPVLILHGKNDDFINYNTTSIMAHKDEFLNTKVEFITLDDPNQSGHNNYFCNAESTAYYNELAKEYEKRTEKYAKQEVPEHVQKDFFSQVDYEKANQPNDELFEQIEKFLDEKVLAAISNKVD